MRQTNRWFHRQGFTLIELLVVIAILAILGAMLFPVARKVREHAVSAQCIGHLRQVALGCQLYANDYDQLVPIGGSVNSGNAVSWVPFLSGGKDKTFVMPKTYIPPDKGVFRCPKWTSGTYGILSPKHINGNYEFNSPAQAGWDKLNAIRIFAIKRTGDFLLIADTIELNDNGKPPTKDASSWGTYSGLDDQQFTKHLYLAHLEKLNALFADFHVETCDSGRLLRSSNDNYETSDKRGINHWVNSNYRQIDTVR